MNEKRKRGEEKRNMRITSHACHIHFNNNKKKKKNTHIQTRTRTCVKI